MLPVPFSRFVSIQKWPVSVIFPIAGQAASVHGVFCIPPMAGYVSPQPLDFPRSGSGIFDLILRIPPEAGLIWKLRPCPIVIYGWAGGTQIPLFFPAVIIVLEEIRHV